MPNRLYIDSDYSCGWQVAKRAPVRRTTVHVVSSRTEVIAVIKRKTIDAGHTHFLKHRPDTRATGWTEVPRVNSARGSRHFEMRGFASSDAETVKRYHVRSVSGRSTHCLAVGTVTE